MYDSIPMVHNTEETILYHKERLVTDEGFADELMRGICKVNLKKEHILSFRNEAHSRHLQGAGSPCGPPEGARASGPGARRRRRVSRLVPMCLGSSFGGVLA